MRITVVCTDAEYARLKGKPAWCPLSVWIKSQVLNGTVTIKVCGELVEMVWIHGDCCACATCERFIGAIVTRTSSPTFPIPLPPANGSAHLRRRGSGSAETREGVVYGSCSV